MVSRLFIVISESCFAQQLDIEIFCYMYVASKVLINKLVHIIIFNVFTSLCYANLFFILILKKTLRCRRTV